MVVYIMVVVGDQQWGRVSELADLPGFTTAILAMS